VVMCHGYGESSDNYLEMASHHAMNGFEVHAIDFMGQGLASGPKNGHFGIQEHHNQVVSMLQNVNEKLACFVQAHSMGCLCITTMIINNPNLNFAGCVLGSPFIGFGKEKKVTRFKRMMVLIMKNHLDEVPLNGIGCHQFLSHDKAYYTNSMLHTQNKTGSFSSGSIINSMIESCEDVHKNAKDFKIPTFCFLAGQDKVVSNESTK